MGCRLKIKGLHLFEAQGVGIQFLKWSISNL